MLPLIGREFLANSVANVSHFAAHVGLDPLPELARSFLAIAHDFFDPIPLISVEIQFAIEPIQKFLSQRCGHYRGNPILARPGRINLIRRIVWIVWIDRGHRPTRIVRVQRPTPLRSRRAVRVADQQTAGNDARSEDSERGENYFPEIHSDTSESWLTAASMVLSKSWDRSFDETTGPPVELKIENAPIRMV